MSLSRNLIHIWKTRNQIWEGISNSIFKRQDVEQIAAERIAVCRSNECGHYDQHGSSPAAYIKGAESCAHCGCKLSFATRSLSHSCPQGKWSAVLTELEDAALRDKLGITETMDQVV